MLERVSDNEGLKVFISLLLHWLENNNTFYGQKLKLNNKLFERLIMCYVGVAYSALILFSHTNTYRHWRTKLCCKNGDFLFSKRFLSKKEINRKRNFGFQVDHIQHGCRAKTGAQIHRFFMELGAGLYVSGEHDPAERRWGSGKTVWRGKCYRTRDNHVRVIEIMERVWKSIKLIQTCYTTFSDTY